MGNDFHQRNQGTSKPGTKQSESVLEIGWASWFKHTTKSDTLNNLSLSMSTPTITGSPAYQPLKVRGTGFLGVLQRCFLVNPTATLHKCCIPGSVPQPPSSLRSFPSCRSLHQGYGCIQSILILLSLLWDSVKSSLLEILASLFVCVWAFSAWSLNQRNSDRVGEHVGFFWKNEASTSMLMGFLPKQQRYSLSFARLWTSYLAQKGSVHSGNHGSVSHRTGSLMPGSW
jgi:hypothetical protein